MTVLDAYALIAYLRASRQEPGGCGLGITTGPHARSAWPIVWQPPLDG